MSWAVLPVPGLCTFFAAITASDGSGTFVNSDRWVTGLNIAAGAGAFLALFAMVMTLINLWYWPRPPAASAELPGGDPLVTVCVPARDEQNNIPGIAASLLAQTHPRTRILFYDDASTDATPRIIAGLCAAHPNIMSVATRPPPKGWNGKQHACWRMAQQAVEARPGDTALPQAHWLLFTDADVRFEPECIARVLRAAPRQSAQLISTFPREIVGSLAEALTVPMIFFILLSYLPFPRMRRTNDPSASAGCGQFLLVRADAYFACGGHEAFKDSMHDGIKLPRALRRAGYHTDLVDATDLCSCRMYLDAGQVWRGFTKNAYEGLGNPALLVVVTVLHAVGHLLPWLLLVLLLVFPEQIPLPARWLALLAVIINIVQRALILRRTGHKLWLALLHPVSIILLTTIQWYSFYLHLTGRRSWRGRTA